jgi:DNA-binding winged helix-turn-helix (wHTH) protein
LIVTSVRFGTCVLDFEARQLTRDGRAAHLSPKAYELLKILITQRPKALSKDELHARIWQGTFVSDDSLATLVAEARAVIGDPARRPTYLRTVHGFGYAFSSAVEAADSPSLPGSAVVGWLVNQGRAIGLKEGEQIVGRDAGAHVLLDSLRVSRRHARVIVHDSAVAIEDLGSRNGTSLNGEPLHRLATLSNGDEITIGGFTLTFRSASDNRPTEADE